MSHLRLKRTAVLYLLLGATLTWSVLCGAQDTCSVTVTSPLNGTRIFLGNGVTGVGLGLMAEAACTYKIDSITLTLNSVAIASPTAAPYVAFYPDLTALGEATQFVKAILNSTENTGAEIAGVAQFELVKAAATADTDGNGIPDNPFMLLTQDGDLWMTRVKPAGLSDYRRACVARWNGKATGGKDITAIIAEASFPNQLVTVTVPGSLFGAGDTGILIVEAARDLDTLLGTAEADKLDNTPFDAIVGNSWYVEVSVLKSQDGGTTYSEVSSADLSGKPVHLRMEGLAASTGVKQVLYRHPTTVESDATTGLYVAAGTGSWAKVTNASIHSDYFEVDLSSLSLLALFEEPETPVEGEGEGEGEEEKNLSWIWLVIAAIVAPVAAAIIDGGGGGGGGGGGPCFIATAAYGTPLADQIDVLRVFRDTWLLNNAAGSAFVDAYYHVSPMLADWVARIPMLALGIRILLFPILLLARAVLAFQFVPALLLTSIAVAWSGWRRKRAR
ncbi:MAG: hypothetical protein QG656_635 [Candidatus Hydrogenedentes bacterium]|nr:hypothetical protein [Candidatus Hydrogenedentota bacterium]